MYYDVAFKGFTNVPDEIAHRVSAPAALIDKTSGSPTEEPPMVENSTPPRLQRSVALSRSSQTRDQAYPAALRRRLGRWQGLLQ